MTSRGISQVDDERNSEKQVGNKRITTDVIKSRQYFYLRWNFSLCFGRYQLSSWWNQ